MQMKSRKALKWSKRRRIFMRLPYSCKNKHYLYMKKIAFLISALTFSVSWGQNGTTTSTPSLFQELTLQNVEPQ